MNKKNLLSLFLVLVLLTGGVVTALSTSNMGNVNIRGNITNVTQIHLTNDVTNHIIKDNATCVIISGDTSTLEIC